MAEIVQRIAVKAVIVREGKVLLIREASAYTDGTQTGKYHFPGGRIEPGEHHIEGLKREVREEVGLEVVPIRPVYIGEWQPTIKGIKNQIVAVFILCETNTKEPTLGADADAYEWVLPAEAGKLPLMEADKEAIKAYLGE